MRRHLRLLSVLALAVMAPLGAAPTAFADTTQGGGHKPHIMPSVGIQPPAVDVYQILPSCQPGAAAGQPEAVNMAYFGGHVQVTTRCTSCSGAGASPAI